MASVSSTTMHVGSMDLLGDCSEEEMRVLSIKGPGRAGKHQVSVRFLFERLLPTALNSSYFLAP